MGSKFTSIRNNIIHSLSLYVVNINTIQRGGAQLFIPRPSDNVIVQGK